MCRKHLLGEHVECHMFLGTMRKGKSLEGYVRNNLLQLGHLIDRHDKLSLEMVLRGFKHNSPMEMNQEFKDIIDSSETYTRIYYTSIVDREISLQDLYNRCPECRLLMHQHNILPEVSSAGVLWSAEAGFDRGNIPIFKEKL